MAILSLGMPKCLTGERVLEFHGRDRHAIDEECNVDGVLALGAVTQLPNDAEDVCLKQADQRRIEIGRWPEGTQRELKVGDELYAISEHVQSATLFQPLVKLLEELGFG